MNKIAVLDESTIDKIAAGEVIERPASVVKELVENAIDAGANAVTVEIKDGGTTFIRITDNGVGIDAEEIPKAFLRHATSKIRKVEDLLSVTSLGFRGEALSSICAVCQVELISKTPESLTGTRYIIEGSKEKENDEIGAPSGTTFLIRNIFFNTPARKKFLKTPQTEAGYISDLMERMALSHPEISFKFINNGQTRLHTSGNHNLKDIIYNIYGRDISNNVIELKADETDGVKISGYIGKPVISRGNRNYENYFINGRYVKSKIISKAIEDAYSGFMMKHQYPFTAIQFQMDGNKLDINVHPTKMEVRFDSNETIYQLVYQTIYDALSHREMIPQVSIEKTKAKPEKPQNIYKPGIPEPFEQKRRMESVPEIRQETQPEMKTEIRTNISPEMKTESPKSYSMQEKMEQLANTQVQETDLFTEKLLDLKKTKQHRIIGQLFDTYWLIEFEQQLYIIDQHAAHEKVLYERTMKSMANREYTSQLLSPPVILTLSMQEELLLKEHMKEFEEIGFEIEAFGGKEYALRAIPDNLFSLSRQDLFIELLDSLDGQMDHLKAESINEKIASMSCKAAVKGNNRLSAAEAEALIDELMTLDNPYNCPHGRPTIISMTKYEIEKKFKRII